MLTLDKKRAEEILTRARACRIVIVGDVMLDEFIWGDVTRISPEAPVPVVNIQRESTRLGGAANVLASVTALGAQATVIGVVGNDSAAEKLRSALRQNGGVQTDETLVCDDQRPTTIKTRIIAQQQMIVRADREHRGQVNGQIEAQVIRAAKDAIENAEALVISDYDKGVVTARLLSEILPLAHRRIPVL
ncbi:MAG TPA: PfkB family carbohydrate kinase, partial [Pyrinomonadaceae bacterium]